MAIFGAGASFDSAQTSRAKIVGGQVQYDGIPFRPPLANDLFADRNLAFAHVSRYPRMRDFPALAGALPPKRRGGLRVFAERSHGPLRHDHAWPLIAPVENGVKFASRLGQRSRRVGSSGPTCRHFLPGVSTGGVPRARKETRSLGPER